MIPLLVRVFHVRFTHATNHPLQHRVANDRQPKRLPIGPFPARDDVINRSGCKVLVVEVTVEHEV